MLLMIFSGLNMFHLVVLDMLDMMDVINSPGAMLWLLWSHPFI